MARAFATAYVEILPDFTRFRSTVQSQLNGAIREVGNASRQRATREAENTADSTTRSLNRISGSMRTIGGAMSTVGTNMTSAITLPVAAAGKAIFETGKQFESSMQKIVGLVGVSQSQVNAWSSELLKMGPAVRRPVTELADALYFATSSGIELSKAMGVVEISGKAATAGLGSTSVIADTLTSAMNAYAKSGLTAAQAGDVLVSAVRDGKVEAAAFAPVLGRLLPTASNLGISFSDMAGTLAVMSRTGLDASEAATSLNAIMSAFLKPAEQSKKALASIGLSAEDVRQILAKPGGLVTAMHLLNNRTQGNDEVLARIIPNVRAYRGVMNVLAQDLPGVSKVLDNARNSTGLLDNAFNAMANTAEGRYNQAMSQIQASMVTLSHSVMPLVADSFARISNSIATVTNAYNSLSPSSQGFILRSLTILAIMGPTILVVGKLITTISSLIKIYSIVRAAIIAFNFTMAISRVAIIAANASASAAFGWIALSVVAIAALVSGLIYAYKNSETFRNIVNAAWASILKYSMMAVNWFTSVAWPAMIVFFQNVGRWAVWLWQNGIVPAWNGIIVSGRAVVSWFNTSFLPATIGTLTAVAAVVTWLWRNVFVPAWNGILIIVRYAVIGINVAINAISAVIRFLAPVAMWLWHNVFQPVFQGIQIAIMVASRFIQIAFGLIQIAIKIVGAVVRWLWESIVRSTFSNIGAAARILGAIIQVAFNVIMAVARLLGGVIRWLWENAVRPAFNFIAAAARILWNVLSAIFRLIVGIVRTVVAPVFTWLWNNVVGPVFRGIGNVITSVWRNILRPTFVLLGNFIRNDVAPAFRAGVSAIDRAWRGLVEIAKVPVRFMVNTVINRGIIDSYNRLADFFKVNRVSHVTLPRGFASGGIFNEPTAIVGEGNTSKPEYVIPTDPRHRSRALALYASLGTQLMADGGILGDIQGMFTGGVGAIRKFFSGAVSSANELRTSPFGVLLSELPKKIIGGAVEKVKSMITPEFGFGDSAAYHGGTGVERWRAIAMQSLAYTHSPISWIGSLLRRMNQESGGNQYAINDWDINAKRGDPSRGLMQTIGATFFAYARELAGRGIYDPFANIVASIRYANAAYGSAPRGWDRSGGYDSGGWLLPGVTMAYNGTGRPERVLPPGAGGGTVINNYYSFPNYIGSRDELVRTLDELKRQRRI